MTTFNVTVEGLDKVTGGAGRVAGELPGAVRAAMLKGAERIAAKAAATAPRITGRMAGSARAEVTSSGAAAVMDATNDGYPYVARKVEPKRHTMADAAKSEAGEVGRLVEEAVTETVRMGFA